jgi:hypothetical protein
MTEQTADVEFRDYQSTVPKVYIVLAWLWVAIPFALWRLRADTQGQAAVLVTT